MIKCPYCGSTAQVKLLKTSYQEDGWTITRFSTHRCGCGCRFETSAVFECDGFETISDIKYPQDNQPISKMAYQMIQAMNKKRGE